MMSENSQQNSSKKTEYRPSISYVVDSLVKMLVWQENEKDLQMKKEIARDQDCGLNTVGSLAKLSQNGLWLKMYGGYCQQNLWGELGETSDLFCQTWPKWGMMRHGVVTELQMSARHIKGKGYLLWPTAVASDGAQGAIIGKDDTYYATSTGMLRKVNRNGKGGSVGLGRLMKLWRTPNANDGNRGNKSHEMYEECLKTGKHAINLIDQIKNEKNWPTTTKSDYKGAGPTNIYIDGKGKVCDRTNMRLAYSVYTTNNKGQLNPNWVEILMGLPIGWTDIECEDPEPWPGWPAPMNIGNWPTMRAGSNRNSRQAIIGQKLHGKHKSDIGLEQAIEASNGVIPRELCNKSELPPRFRNITDNGQYDYEPPRVTTVSKNRAKRLKACGNGCCPQQVYWVFRAIVDSDPALF